MISAPAFESPAKPRGCRSGRWRSAPASATGPSRCSRAGASNPSVGALRRILEGIPTDLASFFSFELPRRESSFYRAADLVEIGKGRVSYRLVGANLPEKKLQMLHEVYAPGADSGRVHLIDGKNRPTVASAKQGG